MDNYLCGAYTALRGGKMRILIVNDDGYRAGGIIELIKALQHEHEVFVCAPTENRSAAGHSLTLRRGLRAMRAELPGCEKATVFAVDGTPVDCLRIAIGNLGCRPELVLSGINQAPNLGTDIISSGTVAAANEAAMLGYPAIAVSRDEFDEEFFSDAAETFCDMLPELMACMTKEKHLLNVNFPHTAKENYKGIRTGYIVLQDYPIEFTERVDENGEKLYFAKSTKLTVTPDGDTSDEKFVRDGYITVTPLVYDYTDYERMQKIKTNIERDF